MENETTDKKEQDWVNGWTLAKYNRLETPPNQATDINEWLDGFTRGTVEACKYEHLMQHLKTSLKKHPESLNLVINTLQQPR